MNGTALDEPPLVVMVTGRAVDGGALIPPGTAPTHWFGVGQETGAVVPAKARVMRPSLLIRLAPWIVTVCPGPPDEGATDVTTGPPATMGVGGVVVEVVVVGAVVLVVVGRITGRASAIGVCRTFGDRPPEEPPFAATRPIKAAAMRTIAVSSQRVYGVDFGRGGGGGGDAHTKDISTP